jgi:hypothetical protein
MIGGIVLSCVLLAVISGDDGVDVKLAGPERELLIGEALPIDVVVKNTGQRAIVASDVLVDVPEPEIKVYLSREGESFQRFVFSSMTICAVRSSRTLQPSQSWMYSFKVLYSSHGQGRLAFEEPGVYFVKIVYPLWLAGSPDDREIESNVIRVRYKVPEGQDALVRPQIQSKEVLHFLQWGEAVEGREDVVTGVAKLLETFPDTGYRFMLRDVLRDFFEFGEPRLDSSDRKRIRSIIGLPDGPVAPDDPNLDFKVDVDLPQPTTLGSLLHFYSEQTHVPLDASEALKQQKLPHVKKTVKLRKQMEYMSRLFGATWSRRGNGYYLSKD